METIILLFKINSIRFVAFGNSVNIFLIEIVAPLNKITNDLKMQQDRISTLNKKGSLELAEDM